MRLSRRSIKQDSANPLPEYIKSDFSLYARECGSFSVNLFRGALKESGTKVVIKIYSKLNDSFDVHKFDNELAIFQMLSEKAQPNNAFLKFYGSSYENDKLILIMESCDTDLMSKISDMRDKNESFSDKQLKEIITKLINSFAELIQQKINHMDIKPHNILFNEDYSVKITDFSVSDIRGNLAETLATNCHPIQGTAGYMAPEIAQAIKLKQSKAHFNPEKADVFSLGLTFLQMKTLEDLSTFNLIENNQKLMEIIKSLQPQWLSTLLSNMLCLDPNKRNTFKELLFYLPEDSTIVN